MSETPEKFMEAMRFANESTHLSNTCGNEYAALTGSPYAPRFKEQDYVAQVNALLAELAAMKALVHLQDAEDGVWVHCHAGGQYFSINLAHYPVARKFCLAYHESLQAKA